MNKKEVLVLGVLVQLSIPLLAQAGLIRDRRCDTWGDTLGQGSEVQARFDWAIKCETDRNIKKDIQISFKKGIADSNGIVTAGYPTYGLFNEAILEYSNPGNWYAPPKAVDEGICNRPQGYEVAFYCAAGCYTPEQELLFLKGGVSAQVAFEQDLKSIQTLTSNATLEKLAYRESQVESYITDIIPGNHEVLNFQMLSGGALRVTVNHPLVNAEGKVVPAAQFKRGEALITSQGEHDTIIEIIPENYFGKVYNLSVDSFDLKENIIVVQGYLNGSVRYQNEYVKYQNRLLLRSTLAAHLLGNL